MSFAELPTWMLSQAHHRAHDILADRLAAAGARGYEYRVLDALAASAPLSQVAIGSFARLDRRDVAVTLAALEEQDLVTRSPDPEDARRNVVDLTPSGLARHAVLAEIALRAQDEFLAPLDSTAREAFIAALARLGS